MALERPFRCCSGPHFDKIPWAYSPWSFLEIRKSWLQTCDFIIPSERTPSKKIIKINDEFGPSELISEPISAFLKAERDLGLSHFVLKSLFKLANASRNVLLRSKRIRVN